ncbi:MAG: hypothetical protein ACRDRU_21190 [Pseudonocardiaceae bacterium]
MQRYQRSAGHADAHYDALTTHGTALAAYRLSFRPQPRLSEPDPPPSDRLGPLLPALPRHHRQPGHNDANNTRHTDADAGLIEAL